MNKLKFYLRQFFHGTESENGSEIVEWCIIVAIVAILAGAVFAVVKIVLAQINNAGNQIGNLDYNSIGGSGGDVGGTPTVAGGDGS